LSVVDALAPTSAGDAGGKAEPPRRWGREGDGRVVVGLSAAAGGGGGIGDGGIGDGGGWTKLRYSWKEEKKGLPAAAAWRAARS
jgi:hypothetical protein